MEAAKKDKKKRLPKAVGTSNKDVRNRKCSNSKHPSSSSASRSSQSSGRPQVSRKRNPLDEGDSDNSDEFAHDAEDWDVIQECGQGQANPKICSQHPTYEFPGAWDSAITESTQALSKVGSASKSYASALSQSGLEKAGRSIGSALASTANKSAFSVAEWTINKTGLTMNELPRPVQGWLEKRRSKGEARRRAEREHKHEDRKRRYRILALRQQDPFRDPEVFDDDDGAFVLRQHDMDSTGEFKGAGPVDTQSVGSIGNRSCGSKATRSSPSSHVSSPAVVDLDECRGWMPAPTRYTPPRPLSPSFMNTRDLVSALAEAQIEERCDTANQSSTSAHSQEASLYNPKTKVHNKNTETMHSDDSSYSSSGRLRKSSLRRGKHEDGLIRVMQFDD